MSESVVLFEKRGHVAIFTLNRPKDRNAVSYEVSSTFEKYMDQFEADDDLWIGILCGKGKVFCAGADLKAVNSGAEIMTEKGGFCGFVKYPRTKPMIAAIDGPALAGGCEIALACDMIVASKNSFFGLPEVKRSLVAAAGGLFRLPRKIPENVASEVVLTGDPISVDRMYQFGFVNRLVEPGNAFNEAMKLAETVVTNAPLAVRESRMIISDYVKGGWTEDQGWQRSTDGFMTLVDTDDFQEGPRAFVEKRAPKWTGKRRSKL
eukprot:Clim_evm5s69 gene=Clim_evmTU5s69